MQVATNSVSISSFIVRRIFITILFLFIYKILRPKLISFPVRMSGGLRRRSEAARLLRLWVRIPPEAWKFVCCDCCVLSVRGICDELITRPEESC